MLGLLLADFEFEVCHVPGTDNQAAENLTRNSVCDPKSEKSLPERGKSLPELLQKSGRSQ